MKRRRAAATSVSSSLIRTQARQLQGLSLTSARAGELAQDAERHVSAVAAASEKLEFEDEPSRFLALLHATRGSSPKR